MIQENMQWKARWTIEKYENDVSYGENKPFKVEEIEQNLALNEGINLLWTLVCGGAGTAYNNANSYIGVGDSTAAAVATQTGLQAVTNKLYKKVEAGYPTYGSNQKAVWRAVFNGNEANYAWQEFSLSNSDSDTGTNLNRKVSNQGTKITSQIWTLQLEITLS